MENQHGFRKGRSTIEVMEMVKILAGAATGEMLYRHRYLCVQATLDVRNAFNSVRWEDIVKELRKRNITLTRRWR